MLAGVDGPSIRRTESQLTGARGNLLFRREWLGPEPERVLLLVHGMAEHSGRYDHVGAWFAARGCAVHAYDQLGHGRSAGIPGHGKRFSDFLDDLDAVLGWLRVRHPGVPVFLVGHSMGGLVVSAFLRERQPDIPGAVTSGALEDSNVELSEQLVQLLIAQRNFQANARTISTSDEITQTIINL